MALAPPPLTSPPHLLCDWIELKTLCEPTCSYRIGSLKRLWDVTRESEDTDPTGTDVREFETDTDGVSGSDDDAFLDSLLGEIQDRMTALGDAYPFHLDGDTRICIGATPTYGGYVYLFCLLLTYANGKPLLDGWRPQVNHKVRDLFQACSTVAAAAEVTGCAISFGWPRPNNNPQFLVRLREVYAMFGEGTVVATPRPGVSPSPKDEEIDIIAWRPRRDGAAGKDYLLGQVASGDNWEGKPLVGGPIVSFHRNWFEPAPASAARASIFIPHAIHPNVDTGTRRERMDAITIRYGVIIDRLRLPSLMQEGIALAEKQHSNITIERISDLSKITHWVVNQITTLRVAAQ